MKNKNVKTGENIFILYSIAFHFENINQSISKDVSFYCFRHILLKAAPCEPTRGVSDSYKESILMKQDENCANSSGFADWFQVGGDIDDFIFYCDTAYTSEK